MRIALGTLRSHIRGILAESRAQSPYPQRSPIYTRDEVKRISAELMQLLSNAIGKHSSPDGRVPSAYETFKGEVWPSTITILDSWGLAVDDKLSSDDETSHGIPYMQFASLLSQLASHVWSLGPIDEVSDAEMKHLNSMVFNTVKSWTFYIAAGIRRSTGPQTTGLPTRTISSNRRSWHTHVPRELSQELLTRINEMLEFAGMIWPLLKQLTRSKREHVPGVDDAGVNGDRVLLGKPYEGSGGLSGTFDTVAARFSGPVYEFSKRFGLSREDASSGLLTLAENVTTLRKHNALDGFSLRDGSEARIDIDLVELAELSLTLKP